MCDDISLELAGDRIVLAKNACPSGEDWFLTGRTRELPVCTIDGQVASVEEGTAQAAKILAGANHPLFFGLEASTCEAQRAAVSLADRTNGLLIAGKKANRALSGAIRKVGIVTATLGEVRHRADVVVFWGVDPATTHARHFERYSLTCRGRFVPRGRADRVCVVVDSERTATADEADLFVQIAPESDGAAVAALFALLRNDAAIDGDEVFKHTGVSRAGWSKLVDQLKAARYGAIFFDPATFASPEVESPVAPLEALLTFVRDLNLHTRCVALTLGAPGNGAGAEQVVSWQTGQSDIVDFGNEGLTWDAPEKSIEDAILSGYADAAVLIASDTIVNPWADLSRAAQERLQEIPLIAFHTADCDPPPSAQVAFTVATPGISCSGTVFRSDGVPLPLRASVTSPYPSATSILRSIEESHALSAAARTSAKGALTH